MSPGSEKTARGHRTVLPKEMPEEKFVAALDVGTTTIRCCIFDQTAQLRGSAADQVAIFFLNKIYF